MTEAGWVCAAALQAITSTMAHAMASFIQRCIIHSSVNCCRLLRFIEIRDGTSGVSRTVLRHVTFFELTQNCGGSTILSSLKKANDVAPSQRASSLSPGTRLACPGTSLHAVGSRQHVATRKHNQTSRRACPSAAGAASPSCTDQHSPVKQERCQSEYVLVFLYK